ncbi:MAG TPA: GTP-binding protein [Euryarchaeota archaeon]|nr:GTP-binding protein [Euryarchaeota archaeon]
MINSKHLRKKVVLIGDSAVGKTSLVRRYVIDLFDDKYIATIGTKVLKKEIEYKLPARSIYLTMMIWDILGQRDYRNVRDTSLKGANGAIIVSDLSRPETISGIAEFWVPQIQDVIGNISMVVIGNKCDLVPEGDKSIELLSSLSSELSSPYFICSAKNGQNVENAFKSIGELVLRDGIDSIGMEETQPAFSLTNAVDFIISDFCEQYGDIPKGMEIIEQKFSNAGVDINAPVKDDILEALELLADVEKDRLGREISEINKLRRWRKLEETESSQ